METVGDEPALRFEVRAAGEIPSFVLSETPPKIKGWKFVQALPFTNVDSQSDLCAFAVGL